MIPRKAHIKRIYGKNVSDDSENTDVWIEVLRIDEMASVENAGGQVTIYRLKWNDNPGTPGQDTATNATREMRTVRIETEADTSVYFEVKAIDKMLTYAGDQKFIRIFKNADTNSARQVTKKRVYYTDTTLPESAEWSDYIAALTAAAGSTDTTQYVDVELVGAFDTREMQASEYQSSRQLLKLNDQLGDLQQTSPASTAARLDPYQSIVNVKIENLVFVRVAVSGSFIHHEVAPNTNDLEPEYIPTFPKDLYPSLYPMMPTGVGYAQEYVYDVSWSYSQHTLFELQNGAYVTSTVDLPALGTTATDQIPWRVAMIPRAGYTKERDPPVLIGGVLSYGEYIVSDGPTAPDGTTLSCWNIETNAAGIIFKYQIPDTPLAQPITRNGITFNYPVTDVPIKLLSNLITQDFTTFQVYEADCKATRAVISLAKHDGPVFTDTVSTPAYYSWTTSILPQPLPSNVTAEKVLPLSSISIVRDGRTLVPKAMRFVNATMETQEIAGRTWVMSQSTGYIDLLMGPA